MLLPIRLISFLLISVYSIYSIEAVCSNIISRQSWGARAPKSTKVLKTNPPNYVVIHHSETPACETTPTCKARIRNIQDFHMDTRNWEDIGYNFLIGGDGNIYEGRGFGKHGAHVPKFNNRSLGICLIGNFQNNDPPANQLQALNKLITCAEETGKLAPNFKVIGHRQGKSTTCPGNKLYTVVTKLVNWDPHPV